MSDPAKVPLDTPIEPGEGTVETPAADTPEADPAPEVDVEKLQATNKRLFERAKKAEAEAKALRGNRPPADQPSPSSQPNIEETVLLANGMPEELLTELKAVAGVRKLTLLKAQNDPLFVAIKDKFEKDQKHKAASLPASRGAGSVQAPKAVNTPNLARDEHRRLAKEAATR